MIEIPNGFPKNFFAPAPLIMERITETLIDDNDQPRRLRAVKRTTGFASLQAGQREDDTVYLSLFTHSMPDTGRTRAGTLINQTWITAVADSNYSDTRGNADVSDDIGEWLVLLHSVLAFYQLPNLSKASLLPVSPPAFLDPLPGFGIYPLAWNVAMGLYNDDNNRNAGLSRWTRNET